MAQARATTCKVVAARRSGPRSGRREGADGVEERARTVRRERRHDREELAHVRPAR
jgi:hypothetical protein